MWCLVSCLTDCSSHERECASDYGLIGVLLGSVFVRRVIGGRVAMLNGASVVVVTGAESSLISHHRGEKIRYVGNKSGV